MTSISNSSPLHGLTDDAICLAGSIKARFGGVAWPLRSAPFAKRAEHAAMLQLATARRNPGNMADQQKCCWRG